MIMKALLFATAAVMCIGVDAAYAGDGDGHSATTLFTLLQGQQPSVPGRMSAARSGNAASAMGQDGGDTSTFITRQNRGTWLFPPNEVGGRNP
jgi:hypothetical protein